MLDASSVLIPNFPVTAPKPMMMPTIRVSSQIEPYSKGQTELSAPKGKEVRPRFQLANPMFYAFPIP